MRVDRCPTCRRRIKRSTQANRLYWLLLHETAERVKPGGQSYGAEVWHTWAKSRFLGCDDVTLPSGKTMTIPKSSADLDVSEFADYVDKVEDWAAERGIFLADREA